MKHEYILKGVNVTRYMTIDARITRLAQENYKTMSSIKDIFGLDDEDLKSSIKKQIKEKATIGVYRRVSTREQADEGQSLAAQLGKINKYIQ